jgi:hypothetical protein
MPDDVIGPRPPRAPIARGVRRNGWARRVVISLDHETFEQVSDMAFRDGTTWAEAARTLIEWGLDTDAG